jgi:hypothetical protein
MLSDILLKTVAVPSFLGAVLAVLTLIFKNRKDLIIGIGLPLASAAVYALLDGLPAFPPVSAKQKLPLIVVAIAIAYSITAGLPERFKHKAGTVAIVAIAFAGIAWLGQNLLISAPLKVALALGIAILIMTTVFLLDNLRGKGREIARISLIPAAFSAAFGFSLIAAFGAFLGMAQANGAMAAMLGFVSLVLLVAYGAGRAGAFEFQRLANLAVGAVLAQFFAATILFTPKLSIPALLIASCAWLVPFLVARLNGRLEKLSPFVRALASGALAFVPAATATGIVAMSLRH